MDTVGIYHRVDGKFNSKVLTKLVANFRSHPDILKVPNELFYESELKVYFELLMYYKYILSRLFNLLQASGDKMMTHSAVNWEYLPKPGFPLIFHGVMGKEDQDASSPR